MNYKEELIVVTKTWKIDIIVEDEKMLYPLNKKISALWHQIQCKSS
jgi:hypothetical protein